MQDLCQLRQQTEASTSRETRLCQVVQMIQMCHTIASVGDVLSQPKMTFERLGSEKEVTNNLHIPS